jgi:Pyruvate/2-oxoacid:ferredoxin oxidoreductase delta subunit
LRGEEPRAWSTKPTISPDRIKLDYYDEKPRAERKVLSAEERLAKPMDEVDLGVTQEAALEETTRCFSCGSCFGCERCWMYCQSNCFKKIPEPTRGHYYKIDLSTCDGCKKCGPECPCGFLDLV